jgi:hypothetical protein
VVRQRCNFNDNIGDVGEIIYESNTIFKIDWILTINDRDARLFRYRNKNETAEEELIQMSNEYKENERKIDEMESSE